MFSEKKIKRKLMILSIVLCLLPVTILYFINEKKLLELAFAEVEIENSQMAGTVDKEWAKMRQTVLLLANNPAWEKYYTEPERQAYWQKEQIKAFQYVKEQIPETDEAYFLDDTHNGEKAVRIDQQSAHEYDTSSSEKDQPFYEAAMQLERGEVYQSEPYVSADSRRWVVGNTTPVVIQEEGPYKGKKVGAIHYEVNLASLSNSLSKQASKTTAAFVVNDHGNVLASSEPAHVQLIHQSASGAEQVTEAGFSKFQTKATLPGSSILIEKSDIWSRVARSPKGTHIVKIDKEKYLVSFQEIKIGEGVNWKIGVMKPIPKGTLFSVSNLLMYVMMLVIFLIILGAAFIVNGILKEIHLSQKRLSTLAHYDTLTELPNRTLFMERIQELLESSKKQENNLSAILFVDLDRFKIINDTMGHATGDLLLKEVAKRLKNCVRKEDIVARFGGDEFVILLKEGKSKEAILKIAERINDSVSRPIHLSGNEYFVNTSIGISLYPDDGVSTEALIKHADLAMYHAKEAGGSRSVFFHEKFSEQTIRRLKLENNIRKAIEKKEFEVYYQPKVALPSEKLVGIEALLRWFHPEIGMISPVEFIPIAEETGSISLIGEWVLRTACKQNKQWQKQGYEPVVMSVNISAYQFQEGHFEKTVQNVLNETGLDGKWLELELTESMLIHNEEAVIKTLEGLKKLGVKISIDDFGTGYSSFSYLKRFPIDTLKIDRSFIKDLFEKEEDKTITQAIIAMGHSLNYVVVAEGVETENQNNLLQSYKCDQIQGYYYSPPVSAENVTKFMESKTDRTISEESEENLKSKIISLEFPLLGADNPVNGTQ